MPMRLTGKPSLAYKGVEAPQPPNIVLSKTIGTITARAPTVNDYNEYNEGDLWMVERLITDAIPHELWYLARKTGTALGPQALWRQIYPGAGGGGGGNLRSEDLVIEIPDPAWGAINVVGGEPYTPDPFNDYVNIYTKQLDPADPYTLAVCLSRTINQPFTNATGTEGMYQLGGLDFLHGFGGNSACGYSSLNLTLNPAVAINNTAVGNNVLHSIQTSSECTGIGANCLNSLVGGRYVIGIGYNAGSVYNANQSSNIIIGHPGIVTDNNLIRIGQMPPIPLDPVGDQQQSKTFVAGIWNCDPVIPVSANTGLVIVDDSGQLYVDDIAPFAVITTDATGNPVGSVGNDGEVLIGATGAAPLWKTLTAGPGIGIANGPNSITLTAGGVGAVVQLGADDGHTALPVGAQINIVGANLLTTSVTPDLGQDLAVGINTLGLADQVIGANGVGVDPTWKTLACSDGSLDIIHTPAGIDITVIGVPPVGGVNYLMDHALQHVTPTLNGIQIEQGANITTVGDIALSKITVSVTDDVELPLGHMYARDNIKTTDGNLVVDLGSLYIQQNTTALGAGAIYFGGDKFVMNYGANNCFLGKRCGNLTFNVGNTYSNTGTGLAVLEQLVNNAAFNSAYGYTALSLLRSGSYNTACGSQSLTNLGNATLAGGSYNSAFGYASGTNYTGNEHSNLVLRNKGVLGDVHQLRLGTHGTSDGQQSDCYIAGIRDASAGTSPEMVVIGTIASGYKVWSMPIPGASASSFVTDSGTGIPAGGILNIQGGYNADTRAASNTVTIDVDGSIQQNNTTAAGDGIYALGTRGAGTYTANRFMHNYGTSSTYLGYQSGPISGVGGTNCVGIGTNALDAAAAMQSSVAVGRDSMTLGTTSSYCTCAGAYSGNALTTGTYNCLLGYRAGEAYDAEKYNIILGGRLIGASSDASTAFDERVMRLGYKTLWTVPAPTEHDPDPVETMTTTGTTSVYVYGVYGASIDVSAKTVYADKYGKLGTDGGSAFSFYQSTSLASVTGDGTVYLFGTSGGLVLDYDTSNGANLTLGGAGAPAVFTCPHSGKYNFTASITYVVPAVVRNLSLSPLYLVVCDTTGTPTIRSRSFMTYVPAGIVGTVQYASEVVVTSVYLNVNETVRWACKVSGGIKNIGILNYDAPIIPGVGVTTCYATYFTGVKVG